MVADAATHRIQVFHPDGTFAHAFGSYGAGVGRFDDPVGVAIAPDGRIVVVDAVNRYIQAFHPNGTPALIFGSYGVRLEMGPPAGVAVAPDGRIVVAGRHPDAIYGGIRIFNTDGTSASDLSVQQLSAIAVSPGTGNGTAPVQGNGTAPVPPPVVDPPPYFGNGTGHPTASVSNALGSSVPGCEATNECFIPHYVTVDFGGEVTWTNDDTAAHTVVGGTLADGPDGTFDSGLIMPGTSFSYTFEDAGVYPYFCVVHPWMEGTVVVGEASPPPFASVPIVVELDRGNGSGEPVNVTSTGVAVNLTINMTGLTGSMLDGTASSTVTFPPSETTVITSFAEVTFPPSVTASHVPADGLLALRISSEEPSDDQVQDALAYGGSGRVRLQNIVEVGGSDSDGGTPRVTFDRPVRILLEGQAGGRAFYIQGADGAITPIDMACAADNTARAEWQLGGAGECQIDSGDGADKIIYTHHLTRFGTAVSESGASPPVVHTCSARLAVQELEMRASPGEHSQPVPQILINSGSLQFTGAELEATPWYVDWGGSAAPTATGHPSLPASISEVSESEPSGARGGVAIGPRDGYREVANGTEVARGLEGGAVAPLWFRVDLTSYDEVQGGSIDQYVTYIAQCSR